MLFPCQTAAARHNGKLAEPNHVGRFAVTNRAELYACLYAKEFPAQALLRLQPELRDRPCVIVDGQPPLQQVCSLTRKARILGLARGMTQTEVETCPSVAVLPRSHKEEIATKNILLECAGAFEPRVEERCEDGALLCVIDIAGTESLFGPPESLAKNLLTRVRELGITVCIAVSSNLHAAVALAKGMPPQTAVKIIAARRRKRSYHLPCWMLRVLYQSFLVFNHAPQRESCTPLKIFRLQHMASQKHLFFGTGTMLSNMHTALGRQAATGGTRHYGVSSSGISRRVPRTMRCFTVA